MRTIGAVILAVVAVVLMFGGPTMTLFGIVLFIGALGLAAPRLAPGIAAFRGIFGSVGAFVGAVGVFLLLWFLFGQFVGIYPIDAFRALIGKSTLPGIFWGRSAGALVVVVVLFTIVAMKIARQWARGHTGLVNIVVVGGCIVAIISVVFAPWRNTVPSAAAISAKLVRIAPLDAPLKWGEPIILKCGGNDYIEPPIESDVRILVPSCPAGWTDTLKRPYGAPGFVLDPKGLLTAEQYFADGRTPVVDKWDPLVDKVRKPKRPDQADRLTGVRFQNDTGKDVILQVRLK